MTALKIKVAFVLFFVCAPAFATWKPQYAQLPQATQEWFGHAEVTDEAYKRFGFKSCCAQSEVVHTKFHVNRVNGADEWFWLHDGKWELIPPDIIHWGESGPNGEAILFVTQGNFGTVPAGTPTCFWPPESGN